MNKVITKLAAEEAQEIIQSVMRMFSCGRKKAIKINEYAVDFMLAYNPISTTPTDRESHYYNHWDLVKHELIGERLGLSALDESMDGYGK